MIFHSRPKFVLQIISGYTVDSHMMRSCIIIQLIILEIEVCNVINCYAMIPSSHLNAFYYIKQCYLLLFKTNTIAIDIWTGKVGKQLIQIMNLSRSLKQLVYSKHVCAYMQRVIPGSFFFKIQFFVQELRLLTIYHCQV